ncbi:MAG: amidophosphoribosyltransferase [Verrucomicrobiota bacterium]|nr:amidophosphoribosyltransferase [Verrucomicrobiota bacterium]
MKSAHDHPKHYCGVFGVFGHSNAAEISYYGLYALQHRGQESAGIVTCNGKDFFSHRDMGLVPQVFKGKALEGLKGENAIGHTRYSTTGASHIHNVQPLIVDCNRGKIAIAHNGNLTNAAELRDELEAGGNIFQTTVDSEIILHLLARPSRCPDANPLLDAIRRIQGAYSLVMLTEKEMIGVRDPHGFRPLSLGKVEGKWVLSSETCAFDLIKAEFVRDVKPGEVVIIDQNGLRSIDAFPEQKKSSFCIFEYVYFARPDSRLGGTEVYQARIEMGRQLAREHKIEADMVVPVPDSGNYAALGYSLESGIPYQMAFVRNHYVGRSFLQPSQVTRNLNVRVKLNLVSGLVEGKKVITIDDSIVRGTTSQSRIKTLKEAGAKEVHVLISCPPHQHPCVYGIDFPNRDKLLAARSSMEEIRRYLDADSIGYLSEHGMVQSTGKPHDDFCMACYNGKYPVPYHSSVDKEIIERRQFEAQSFGDLLEKEKSQSKLI